MSFERFTLPNGLTALVHTDHSTPSVFVGLWYKTGSRDEPPGKTGFAHLFEHLMFQSTAHRPQEYMAALKGIGAVGANGMTRTDDTVYFETVPTNALDSVLWLESDRMGYLDGGITQALLDEQRRVVLNEKRQGELRPEEMAWRHFLTAFYPAGHPYAHPTIGSTEDIEGATLEDVKHWFQGHYGAGNAVIVLSGDIDAATARDKITRYFGAIRPGTPISRPLQWTPPLTETRRDRLYGNFTQAGVSRSWPIPNTSARETTLLLAARAMAGPKDAPLVRALVTDAKVATGVTATVNESALGSVLNVAIALRPGVSPEAAGRALDIALADYAAKGPAPSRLQSIIAATDASLLRSLDDNAAIGNRLGEGEVAHDDPAYFLKQREWINAARPDEVRAVAAQWLARPYYELITLPVPDRKAAPADVDRSHMPAPGPFKSQIAFPSVTTMTLANGLKMVVARRPGTATADMSLQFASGTRTDPGIAPGVVTQAFDLLAAGTTARSGEPIERRLSQLGIQLGAQAGPWDSTVRWSVANNRLDDSFALVSDLVRHPAYPPAAVEDARASTLRRSDAQARNPFTAGVPLLQRAIWGNGDARGHIPTAQDAAAISRPSLVAYQARHIIPGNATLYIVGDIAPDRAKALAERYFGTWRDMGPQAGPAAAVVPEHERQGPRLILVDAPGAPQSSITVGAPIPPFDKDRSATENLTAAMLADIGSGRLNANLRQAKGWSYGFGGEIQDAPTGDRLFVARGTVQADRTAASLAELRREFTEFTTTRPPTEAELNAQRAMMIRAATLRYARNEAFLDSLETSGRYKLAYDRPTTLAQRLDAVTLGEVQDSARHLLRPDRLTWAVIGDLRTIEPQIRALGLAPAEIWDVHGNTLR